MCLIEILELFPADLRGFEVAIARPNKDSMTFNQENARDLAPWAAEQSAIGTFCLFLTDSSTTCLTKWYIAMIHDGMFLPWPGHLIQNGMYASQLMSDEARVKTPDSLCCDWPKRFTPHFEEGGPVSNERVMEALRAWSS